MLGYLFDLLFLIVALSVAYWISQKGMAHSATYFVAVLIASLLAITMFEPASNWAARRLLLPADIRIANYFYFLICIGIFAATLASFLWCIHVILPDAPKMSPRMETIGSWVFGVLTGYLFAAFLLTALLAFPAPREYWGAFAPEPHRRPGPIMASAPDFQFLTLTEYTCDHAFAVSGGAWLLDRPAISAQSSGGRWSSYPIRYALWREAFEHFW